MNNMFKREIGHRLRIARENAGLKQDDVAKVINSTFQKVSSFETGRTRVDLETLVILCNLYKTNTDYILNPELNKNSPTLEMSEEERKLIFDWRKLSHDNQMKVTGIIGFMFGEESAATNENYVHVIKRMGK